VLSVEDDGYIDPAVLAGGYLAAARDTGSVDALSGTTATELLLDGSSRVCGVRTCNSNHPEIEADVVIDAAGAWAGLLAVNAGLMQGLPMAPTRSHYWISKPMAPSLSLSSRSHPLGTQLVLPIGAYTRPEGFGMLLGIQESLSQTYDQRELPIEPTVHQMIASEQDRAEASHSPSPSPFLLTIGLAPLLTNESNRMNECVRILGTG